MKRLAIMLSCGLGCSGTSVSSSVAHPVAPVEHSAPAAPTTVCYAGVSSAGDHKVRTIARRTVDPAARQIVEDVSHNETGTYGTKRFHVVMNVDGDHFTMKEASGAFTGTGTLVGAPWQWTSWTSISQVPEAGVEVESRDELTPTGIQATKQIRKDGKVVTTAVEQLAAFDCAEWDAAEAALAAPVLDQALCDHACRNYATVMYWSTADAEIARLPPEARDEARKQKAAALGPKLEAGVPACATQCLESHNLAQVACMDRATSAPALRVCFAQ
jgi:hypothetical protein